MMALFTCIVLNVIALEAKAGGDTTSFFKDLDSYINVHIDNQIPIRSRDRYSPETFFAKRASITAKYLSEKNWCVYFMNECPFIHAPTSEDQQELNFSYTVQSENIKALSSNGLSRIIRCLIYSLKQCIDNGLENDVKTLWLKQYFEWCIEENNQRPEMPYMNTKNEFEEYLQHVKRGKQNKISIEECRQNGSMCIFCQSTNIISNGSLWTCKDCKKSFRKH